MSDLAVEALTLTLGGRAVLDGVDARFAAGKVTALLGHNGAGKSTLLACLAGVRSAECGRVLLNGQPRASL